MLKNPILFWLRFISTLFLMTLPLSAQENEESKNKELDYNALLVEALEGYQELMTVKINENQDQAASSWNLVSRAIQKGYLRFTVDPAPKGIMNSIRFNAVPGKDLTHIIVSRDLLDLWMDFPSTVYSVISSGIEEASTFFHNPPDWVRIKRDNLESLMLKVHGYTTQAELIENRLIPGAYVLSNYDSYIVDSYTNDSLISVVLFLEQHSLPVAQGLYQARLIFEEDEDEDVLRKTILNLGEGLLEKRDELPSITEDKEIYPLAVAIHSWLEFTPEMIARIHNRMRADKPLDFEEILKREEAYEKIRGQLERSRTRDMPLILKIAEEIRLNFIISKP